MEKKVFSVEDNTLRCEDELITLHELLKGGSDNCIATNDAKNPFNLPLLPSTLIRKQPTDEELAEEYAKKQGSHDKPEITTHDFIEGRKSFGDKEFHLSEEQVHILINKSRLGQFNNNEWKFTRDDIIASLTPPIYPHTITVDFDGEKYYWETLKAEY